MSIEPSAASRTEVEPVQTAAVEPDQTAVPSRELQGIIADYQRAYPSAMVVIERDLPALVAHLQFPAGHASGSARRTRSRGRSRRSVGAPR